MINSFNSINGSIFDSKYFYTFCLGELTWYKIDKFLKKIPPILQKTKTETKIPMPKKSNLIKLTFYL